MIKIVWALFATALFVVILLAVYFLHVKFFAVNVVFYAAIIDSLVAALLAAALLFLLSVFRPLGQFEKSLLVAVWLLGGYAYAISIPTVIDRSLSFYILEKLEQRGGGIQLERFEDVFAKEYLHEHRLVDVRLTEQEESGTIVIENGCVKLTDKGRKLASFSVFFRHNLLPSKRLLRGEYTDDLVDPFKHSIASPDYKC